MVFCCHLLLCYYFIIIVKSVFIYLSSIYQFITLLIDSPFCLGSMSLQSNRKISETIYNTTFFRVPRPKYIYIYPQWCCEPWSALAFSIPQSTTVWPRVIASIHAAMLHPKRMRQKSTDGSLKLWWYILIPILDGTSGLAENNRTAFFVKLQMLEWLLLYSYRIHFQSSKWYIMYTAIESMFKNLLLFRLSRVLPHSPAPIVETRNSK